MEPFVGNDYRKRVLAAVEKRGGPSESDSFELYDLPIEEAERLDDAAVAARLDEVWAFWQKQRDHPKYRILVARLVAEHDERSAPLRHVRPNRLDPLKSTMGSSFWTRAWDTGARRCFQSGRFSWARGRRRASLLPTARGKPPFLKRYRANFPPASAREAWWQTESANADQPNSQNSSI